jgi:hypothetical protein
MSRASKAVAKFLRDSTTDQARAVAKSAKTSLPHLRHVAAGRRGVSADLAQRLAHASKGALDQRTLCDACNKCPLLLLA